MSCNSQFPTCTLQSFFIKHIQIAQLFETLQPVITFLYLPDSLVNWAEKHKTNLRMMETEVPL